MCLITIMSAKSINKGAYKHQVSYDNNKCKKLIVDFLEVEE